MKKFAPWIIIVILIGIIFLMRSCDGEKSRQKIDVIIPEQKGEFEPKKPTHTDSGDSTEIKWKDRIVSFPNPVNDSLVKAYQKLSDSLDAKAAELERWKMYIDAIEIRNFNSTFEDDFVKIDISGKVQGEVKSIEPTYTIKERTIQTEIQTKKTVLRLLAGAEIGNNTLLNDFQYKLNLGVQNAKGDIFRGSYSKMHGQDYIFVGYDFSIFEVR